MESYTREIVTATQKFGENAKLSTMLEDFAQALFKDGLIQLATRYNKETGEVYKELRAKLIREER